MIYELKSILFFLDIFNMNSKNLAQLNIARLLAPIDDPQIADFVAKIDEINLLAESDEGFVWRLKDDTNNATSFHPFGDEKIIITMSVWKSVEALKEFTYKSGHAEVMKNRAKWFEKHIEAYLVLWWIPEDHIPTIEEAKERLQYLNENGESEHAFTFRKLY